MNKKTKQTLTIAGIILAAAAMIAIIAVSMHMNAKYAEENPEPTPTATPTAAELDNGEGTKPATGDIEPVYGKHHVEIEVQDYGTISVELDGDAAPITVANFLKLAGEGFYDGLTFHRVISGFMIQGGDPTGTGTGSADDTITGEFAANGVENSLSHTRGAISMARAQSYNSASCQFFIVHQDCTALDGNYAAFGYVTDGMDVVDQICADIANVETDENGIILAAADQPVITAIRVID